MPRRPLLLETFEDRILSSVTAPAQETPDIRQDFATTEARAEVSSLAHAASHEIVFVDTGVADFQKLVDDLISQGSADRRFDVVLLDANRDGIAQINAALADEHDLAAIHIISHGGAGVTQIGGTRLDAAELTRDADAITRWGRALTADGDLLLYGCDVAASAGGRTFVQRLAG